MYLLAIFKTHLASQDTSPVTVKNYISDVSRFIRWYQTAITPSFRPQDVTYPTLEQYFMMSQASSTQHVPGSTPLSSRSIKRHAASLRKFFSFLKAEKYISEDPFVSSNTSESKQEKDELALVAFKEHLYKSNCSYQTIKNYIIDVKQFMVWIAEVSKSENSWEVTESNIFSHITQLRVEEYKKRLLQDALFSPASVNRKLSSIRRYLQFLHDNNLLGTTQGINIHEISNVQKEVISTAELDFALQNQSKLYQSSEPVQKAEYASFPPLRMLQKSKNGVSYIFDSLFIVPLAKAIETTQYTVVRITGKTLFKSFLISTKASHLPASQMDTLILNSINAGQATVEVASALPQVKNISKAFYAPHAISVTALPLSQRIVHQMRHSRPQWYKRYHQFAIVHYLHFAILLVYAVAVAFGVYHGAFGEQQQQDKSVLAAFTTSPPRMLAFRGRLMDEQQLPITATKHVRFSLYNTRTGSGSALLWQEVTMVKPDNQGQFATTLGTQTAIPENILSNPSLYLGIAIENGEEMAPREQLATVGLAKDAQTLQGLLPSTKSTESKNVLLALDSAGNVNIGGKNGTIFQATEGQFTLTGESLLIATNPGSNGNIVIAPDMQGMIDLKRPLINTSEDNSLTGAIGSVEVNDTFAIIATSSAVPALSIHQESTGMLISASSSGTAKFSLDYTGNAVFAGDLAVNGTSLTTDEPTFNIVPENAVNVTLGNSATSLSLGATTGTTTIRHTFNVNGSTVLGDSTTDTIIFKGQLESALIPNKSSTYDIGSEANTWNNAYLTNVFVSPTATVSGFLKRTAETISMTNNTDRLLIGTQNMTSPLISLAGKPGENSYLSSGNVGIGTTTPTTDRLHVSGDVRIGTSGTDGCVKRADGTALIGACSSDMRLKKDIAPITDILGKLTQLQPVTYTMRSEEFPQYGFGQGLSYGLLAQEVEAVFPHLVGTDANGFKTVKYGPELTMLSLQAIRELAIQIQNTESHLQSLAFSHPLNAQGDILVQKNNTGEYTISQSGSILDRLGAFSKLFAAQLTVGFFRAQEATVDSLAIATDKVTIAGITLEAYVEQLIDKSLGTKIVSSVASNTIAATVISPLTKDAHYSLTLDTEGLTVRNGKDATSSAVARIDRDGNASFSGTLTAKDIETTDATVSGTLRAGKIVAASIEGLDEKLATLSGTTITNITNIYTATQAATSSPSAQPNPESNNQYQSASPSANENEENELTTNDNQLITDTYQITTDYSDIASFSASLAYVPSLRADFATVTNGLMVYGPASMAEISVANQLSISGNLILSENSMNVLGADLELQPLRQGNISFMAGLMDLDTNGNLKVAGNATFAKNVRVNGTLSASLIAPVPGSDLVFKLGTNGTNGSNESFAPSGSSAPSAPSLVVQNASGSGVLNINDLGDLIASGSGSFKELAARSLNIVRGAQADTSSIETVASGSAGVSLITRGYTTRTIFSPYVTKDALIYISPRSETTLAVPFLARQTEATQTTTGSFTVQIPYQVTKDIEFNWWIIN